MHNLRIDAHHQDEIGIVASNVFGGVSKTGCATKFLKTDQVAILLMQVEEKLRLGLETVIRAVVDHCRQITSRLEYCQKMCTLCCGGCATRQHAWNQHQPGCSIVASMLG